MRYTAVFLGFACWTWANAQWTVVNLHPPGAGDSGPSSVRDGKQGGGVNDDAGIWSGTAGSWQSLHPHGFVEGIAGNQQVGHVGVGNYFHASLWEGTPESWVDLHPANAEHSLAFDTSGDQQVGYAQFFVGYPTVRAGLWTGTPESWRELHPAHTGALSSWAFAMDDGVQVGHTWSDKYRAGLWTGTASSWVELHPDGSLGSHCQGVGDGQQVGDAFINGADHASLWRGTKSSWVDLHPVGAASSMAHGVDGGVQVGWVGYPNERASLWYGTAGSYVDLQTFLPEDCLLSVAGDVWRNGSLTYIVGGWYGSIMNRGEAVMWVSRSVAPTSYSMVRGSVFSGNLASLLSSENNRLVMRPGFVFSVGEPPVQVRVNATA
ncbi:MAG: hypothetical protein M3R13_11100, partial [Armatimonadota bacterium]|nr:hypothetical protein [Armatimonadota bacterium]